MKTQCHNLYTGFVDPSMYVLTLPSKHLVSITIVGSSFSQIIRQNSPTVFGKGPVVIIIIIHFVYVNYLMYCILTLSSYIGIWFIVALRVYKKNAYKSMI